MGRDGEARTGKASLKYVNTDAGRYRLCSQSVPVRAGWKCRFSVWVKTEAVAGADRTIAVKGNRFSDTLKRLQVRIYELKCPHRPRANKGC